MRKSALTLLTLIALSGAASLLTACNTVEGAGHDVSAVGHGVSNAAEDTKDKM
jgi:predicted small secreted protein